MLKRVSYKYILIFLLFTSLGGFAQNIFPEGEDAFEPDSIYAVRNAIKVDPIQVVFGVYGFNYERIIKNGYSVEVGLGITRRNYASGWFDYSLDNLGKNVDIETGYAISIAVRKYFQSKEELEGPYLSAGISIKNYKTDYLVIDSLGDLTDYSFPDVRTTTSFSVIFGYQALAQRSNVFADFYIGAALRYKDFDIVTSYYIHDPSAYYVSKEYSYAFGVEVGVKIGFGF